MKEQLIEIIEHLMLLPEIIISDPLQAAFSLGLITAQLKNISKNITYGNGEF